MAHFLYSLFALCILFSIQGCRPARVVNVRTNFNTESKKLALKIDLKGNPKKKYDLDIRLGAKDLEYKISANEISPKQINIGPGNDLSFTIISKTEILNDNYFMVKLTPKQRKFDLSEQEIITIKADTNKSIQDQLINPTVNFALTNKSFVHLGTNPFSNYPSTNYANLSLGFSHIYSKLGYYIEIGSTLSKPLASELKNNNKSVISAHSSNIYYSFTNNNHIDRMYITTGALIRIVPFVIGSIGIGYGKRTENWEVEEIITSGNNYVRSNKFSEYVNASFNGPQLQLGVLIDFNRTNIKISTTILPQTGQFVSPSPYLEGGISIGLTL